jgi:hypothetical protein
MVHYTLMQIAIPEPYKNKFLRACSDKLEYFIDAKTILGPGTHSLAEVDAVFDLSSSEEFKTIAVKINPFKRVVLDFLAIKLNLSLGTNDDRLAYYAALPDMDDFNKFVEAHFADANPDKSPLINSSPYYFTDTLSVDYLLEFDIFADDVKRIPEFKDEPDTDYMKTAQDDTKDYKSMYSPASVSKVTEVYAVDLAKYGYTF